MLVRYPQPADLDNGGKFWTRVQASPTPEFASINLLNQIPPTHALCGIQTRLATGSSTAAMRCPQAAQSVCDDPVSGAEDRGKNDRLPRTRLCCMRRPASIE